MILSAQTIRQKIKLTPFEERKQALGLSYGLSAAGYDIRIGHIGRDTYNGHGWVPAESYLVRPGEFVLLSSLEHIEIPDDVLVKVHDKSTLARQGLALQNTVLEPGWRGFITLELTNHGSKAVRIVKGQPIAQLVFHQLDMPTEQPYEGKYQDQEDRPVQAIFVQPEEVKDAQ